jgi:cell division protein FtsN
VTGTPPAAAPVTRDPAAILADRPASAPKLAAGADPFLYFVQAGAYGRTEDAEQQRAKLAMLGVEGKLTEREQAGRTVYRVRIGPFERRGDAEATKAKLGDAGVETALVRVQR